MRFCRVWWVGWLQTSDVEDELVDTKLWRRNVFEFDGLDEQQSFNIGFDICWCWRSTYQEIWRTKPNIVSCTYHFIVSFTHLAQNLTKKSGWFLTTMNPFLVLGSRGQKVSILILQKKCTGLEYFFVYAILVRGMGSASLGTNRSSLWNFERDAWNTIKW